MSDSDWQTRVDGRLHDIEKRMASVEQKSAIDEVHRSNVEKRLSGIEGTLQKLVWLVITSLVGAIMYFIIGGGIA